MQTKDGTKVVLYIGANNTTKVVDMPILTAVLDEHLNGYTIQKSTGVWCGDTEPSVVVTILYTGIQYDARKVRDMVVILKDTLKQDAIIMEIAPTKLIFI